MLYKLFKWLFYFTTKAYFRSLYIQGKHLVPKKGPVLFVANHSSAFMDPILLAVHIQRSLYFLARGDVFKNKIASALFNKLHMIPVYKPDVSPDDMHKNEAVFEKCYEHLENQKTILLFPEGVSKTERRLRKIKTGVARIALEAEHKNNFELKTTIVPIGINYSNTHHFKSDVFVNFGPPIDVNSFQESYLNNPKEGVLELTNAVKEALEGRMVIVEDDRLDKIIKQIEILYRSKLRDENSQRDKAPQDFYLSKDIVKAVSYFSKTDPKKLATFETKITQYLAHLKKLKIRDTQVLSSKTKLNLLSRMLYFIIGFPSFMLGYLTNIIPYKLTAFLSSKILVRKDFIGSLKLALGMFIFLFIYLIEASLFGAYTSTIWGVIFFVFLYPFGLFTINYRKEYYLTRGNLKYLLLFMRKGTIIDELKSTRAALVAELEESKETYLKTIA